MAGLAGVGERLRLARNVHDILGLGLFAAALKADLIGRLADRDEGRARAELRGLIGVCESAKSDILTTAYDEPVSPSDRSFERPGRC
jgi:two-component system sensor histidine kinase DesK